jgi:hypothetical protein
MEKLKSESGWTGNTLAPKTSIYNVTPWKKSSEMFGMIAIVLAFFVLLSVGPSQL